MGKPYITYCNSTWSSTYISNLNGLYCLQKRDVRAVNNSDHRAHSAPLFSKLGILDIYQLNTFQIAKFMYYYHNSLLPQLFLNLFYTNSQIHGYSPGTTNNYPVHHCRTNLKKFTFFTKVQRSGIPFLLQSLHCQVFPILRKNC